MTIGEAIYRFNAKDENGMEKDEIISHLSHLDGRIHSSLIGRYSAEDRGFSPYPADVDLTDELLVPFPYDDIYLLYLSAMNALECDNTQRYCNLATLFNERYAEFASGYVREHKCADVKIRLGGAGRCFP